MRCWNRRKTLAGSLANEGIVTWLNTSGAKADFIYLGDRGITGNGHMLMLENNSNALAGLIREWIESP
jgi:hypothetical protein